MHRSTNNFDLSTASLPEPSKTKCGDHRAFHFMESEKRLILTLADGVGSNVCDWKASKVACETFIQNFIKKNAAENVAVQLEASVRAANAEILNEDGQCKGMKTTFLAVVWDFESHQIYYAGIGDSRIYKISGNEFLQITKDETTSIVRKGMDGKPLVFAGVTVVGEAVTNVLGALVTCAVHQMDDANTDALLLASDGFYGCQATLASDMLTILQHENMEPAFQKLVQTYRQYQTDDLTAMLVRKKELGKNASPISWVNILEGEAGEVSKFQKIKTLSDGLSFQIEEKNAETCRKIMDFCQKEGIVFERENVNAKIKSMIQHDFQDAVTYRALVNMLRVNQ